MQQKETKAGIFGLLFLLANRLQILGDKVDPDITIKQWLFLAVIPQCGSSTPTMTEIANVMGTSHQNAKKMALLLEKRGFVTLSKDPRDARAMRVSLTEACEAYFKAKEPEELAFIESLFHGFSGHELAGFYAGLERLMDNIRKLEKEYEKKG